MSLEATGSGVNPVYRFFWGVRLWNLTAVLVWPGLVGWRVMTYPPAWSFAPLFGPAIKAVHKLTRDPILISETGAAPVAGKANKITDLFAGVRDYGLLGLVWFDVNRVRDWRLDSPGAIAAFRAGVNGLGELSP